VSESFLSSNGIIAKFVFIILTVIVFLFLMNLGISLLGYYLQPANNPFIVKGMIQGTNPAIIPRDPKKMNSVVIKHSNNQKGGMEFTWSLWLYLQNNTNEKTQYSHIFNVGNNIFDDQTGLATVENGPGLYLANFDKDGKKVETANLHLVMDTVPDGISFEQSTDITNLPYDKWFNVVIKLRNTTMDVYVNGTIASRLNFINVPKQNYNDINVCSNGGFVGSLSDLRYYNYALNVFDINYIVYKGPNTSVSSLNKVASTQGGFNYLSNSWYASKYQNV
jgi:hypothetical protein